MLICIVKRGSPSGRVPDANEGAVGRYPLTLRPATPEDSDTVCRLVGEAADWLRTCKDTGQWAQPRRRRSSNVRRTSPDLATPRSLRRSR